MGRLANELAMFASLCQLAVLTDSDDLQMKMSLEQRADFVSSPLQQSVVIFVCLIGSLVFSFTLFVGQVLDTRWGLEEMVQTLLAIIDSRAWTIVDLARISLRSQQGLLRSQQVLLRSQQVLLRSQQVLLRSQQVLLRSQQVLLRSQQGLPLLWAFKW